MRAAVLSRWDKAATIRYRRPGRGTVAARFEISRARIEAIRSEVAERGRAEPTFTAEIRDAGGDLVAEVDRVISVRRRERSGRPA